VRTHRLFVLFCSGLSTMTIPIHTNLAALAAQLGTLLETDRKIVLSHSPSATTIDPTPAAVLLQSAQDPVSPRSQPNRELLQMPTIMAPARRRQSAITDHFRGASSQRTTLRHTSSRRAAITHGSMPRYQAALPGMQVLQQHQASPARPMISASIQDT
jgi:hypothetical protein